VFQNSWNKTVTELISGNYFSCAKNTKILEQNSTDLIDGNDFSCVKRVPQPDATKPLRLQSKGLEGTAQITIYGKQRRNKLSTGTANLTQDFKYLWRNNTKKEGDYKGMRKVRV
jgi:hypothetical protein